jgi:hypothetical protein
MPREFEGLVGPEGLCLFRLRSDRGEKVSLRPEQLQVPIWAIVDAEVAQSVLQEQCLGNGRLALRILESDAIDLGIQYPVASSGSKSHSTRARNSVLRLVVNRAKPSR